MADETAQRAGSYLVSEDVAKEVADALTTSREDALVVLEEAGFETGKSGRHGSSTRVNISTGPSRAEKIKRQIDHGERDPDYGDVLSVSCSLLATEGWWGAW